ncbi:NADH-quinone oxidoreductase subunit C [Sphingomonas sp. QA11]|uniref:NADH-quinone oxidoreductase subunit C n=1 Tax=Sphingomonas sp. QA11 TaxID=2950605 RepID=UPI0023495548|nr:NADH-quinone oxidoreductase subunit C [Sphingomonas sp. QA11]WCM27926.1 NADH-quinone oxidoreductase subunit C [Sphingomonas sp. QA11]
MRAPAPAYTANDGVIDRAGEVLGASLLSSLDAVGEVALTVDRLSLVETMVALRDTPGLEYQQLMEIAGVDYPERADRFEVVYCLLSLTRNHRIRVHVQTDEEKPVPSVTGIWPVAGWLEREVYDMYGVLFSGNADLRRILTDYGFRGHPQRKDFPLSGYVELRYSEEAKRVVYEPVQLAQDFRSFDFMSPWEGAEYILPGDEKAKLPEAKGAPTPLKADEIQKADAAKAAAAVPPPTPKTTESPAQTGAGKASPDAEPKPAEPDVVKKPRAARTKPAASDDAPKVAKPRTRKKPDTNNG